MIAVRSKKTRPLKFTPNIVTEYTTLDGVELRSADLAKLEAQAKAIKMPFQRYLAMKLSFAANPDN